MAHGGGGSLDVMFLNEFGREPGEGGEVAGECGADHGALGRAAENALIIKTEGCVVRQFIAVEGCRCGL